MSQTAKHNLDIEGIRDEMETSAWEEVEPGRQERRVFLGTVMALYPSGKYYMPFACSNITEEEGDKDQEWREAVEEDFTALGYSLENGDGDPCDLFAVESRDIPKDGDKE